MWSTPSRAERSFAGPAHVVGIAPDRPHGRIGGADDPELGGQHHLVPATGDGPAHQLLVEERAVHVGGVEEGHPEVEGPVDGGHRLVFVSRPVELAHAHAAETLRRRRRVRSYRASRVVRVMSRPYRSRGAPGRSPCPGVDVACRLLRRHVGRPYRSTESRHRRSPGQLLGAHVLARGVGEQRVAGPEVGRRHPVRQERPRRSSRPWPRAVPRWRPPARRAPGGRATAGRAGAEAVSSSQWSPGSR